MSLKVIELHDNALRVGDESGILVESPGFALAVGQQLELGDAAKQQTRIQPTNSYNKYWNELSLDPLPHAGSIRHLADIAYAHLLHLAELGGIDGDVIFAVPGNFTRQQLAILLGLAKQSPFQAVGLVDSALAAAIPSAGSGPLIYAEMQLHQVVLSKLIVRGNQLFRDAVIQVPGVGSQSFMDLMMHLATGLFIQQCRFNPQHDAESEQQLYNALPYWLHQKSSDQNSLILELQSNTTVHTAKMPRESLANNFAKHFKSISQQIAELAKGEEPKILLSSEFADLPGFTASLGGYRDLKILPAEAISTTTLHYRDHIAQSTDQIQLINSLPLINSSIVERNPEPTETLEKQQYPTHILIGSNAIPLSNADLLEGFGQIEQQNGIVYLDSGKKEFLLNQNKVVGKHEIRLGDQIVFPEGNDEIRLIQVNNG
jgi:hypothetical protein